MIANHLYEIAHKAIKLLATFMLDNSKKEDIKTQMAALVSSNDKNTSVNLIAAILSVYDENTKEAVVYLSQESTMEQ